MWVYRRAYGGFLNWGYPKIIHFNRIVQYKLSSWLVRSHHLWTPPYLFLSMNPMSAAKVQSAMDYTQELVHTFVAANILAPVCLEGPGVHPSNINQIAGEIDPFFQGKLSGLPICPEYHLIARNGEHQICFLYFSVTWIGIWGCPQANKLFPIFRDFLRPARSFSNIVITWMIFVVWYRDVHRGMVIVHANNAISSGNKTWQWRASLKMDDWILNG